MITMYSTQFIGEDGLYTSKYFNTKSSATSEARKLSQQSDKPTYVCECVGEYLNNEFCTLNANTIGVYYNGKRK